MLGRLAGAVVKTGEDVWYSGDTSDLAPQVEAALDAYVDESHTKAMAVLPLSRPRDEEARFAEGEEVDPARVIGALIVEQMVDSRTPDGFLHRVDVVRTHSATALANALEYEGLFLMPLWRALGKSTRLLRGRTLPKTLAVSAALIGLVLFLCFYPWDFKLEGRGELKPSRRQPVWAEVDGKVDKLLVKHDDVVKQGQVLLVQRSIDLEKEIVAVRGELARNMEKIRSTRKELINDDELSEVERSQKESEIKQLNRSVESLQKQLDLLLQKQEHLKIHSPIDGRIITWNVEDRLLGRLVNRGEELLEVADPNSPWELEVTMPESRMGHIARAWAESNGKLPVTFFLALNPGEKLEGQVTEIHRSAEVRGEEGNTVLLRVSFDQNRLREVIAEPKIDAGATAKVHCGKRAIGYVYLHDLVDFIRAKILFRLF
jgi:hypothetical protein